MGFTKRALEEQKFLRENYPRLWTMYDEMTGLIAIPEVNFKNSPVVRDEVFSIIAEKTADSRYVMYREEIPREDGITYDWGYVICSADIVE